MKVTYKYYHPNQGLEELQAEIYTKASGLPTDAKRIQARYKDQKKDFKTTIYAITETGAPLAYVQATDSTSRPGRTHISFPWALPECPPAVQEKIFDELLNYIKQRQGVLEITTPIGRDSKNIEECIKFLQRKGFVDKEHLYYYFHDFEFNEIHDWERTPNLNSLTSKIAATDDLDHIIDLCLADPNYQFFTKEFATHYFNNYVFIKSAFAILIFDQETLVAAGAATRLKPDNFIVKEDEEERIVIRISPTRPGYSFTWKKLLMKITEECISIGWINIPIRVYFRFLASSTIATNLAEILPNITDFEYIFVYKDTIE